MTLREQLEAKNAEYRELDIKRAALEESLWHIEETRQKLRAGVLLEEIDYLLGWYVWHPKVYSNAALDLEAVWDPADHKERKTRFEALAELCSVQWHDDFDIEEGVSLSFDDGDIHLRFKDAEAGVAFLKRTGLLARVNVEDLRRVAEESREVAAKAEATARDVDRLVDSLL